MLAFQIVHADAVPQALKDFLGDENIKFCSVATDNDVKMLSYYGIVIPRVHNFQRVIRNPICNYPPALYALSNAYIGTNMSKKGSNTIVRDRWSNFPVSIEKIMYATWDASLSFEIARSF
jgi:hypothetical protein